MYYVGTHKGTTNHQASEPSQAIAEYRNKDSEIVKEEIIAKTKNGLIYLGRGSVG